MNKKKTDYLFSSAVYLRIFFFKILDSNFYNAYSQIITQSATGRMFLKSINSAVPFRTEHFIYRIFKVLKAFSNWQVVSILGKEALFCVFKSLTEIFQVLNSKPGFLLAYGFVTWVSTSVLIFRNVIHYSSLHKCSLEKLKIPEESLNKGRGVEKSQFK